MDFTWKSEQLHGLQWAYTYRFTIVLLFFTYPYKQISWPNNNNRINWCRPKSKLAFQNNKVEPKEWTINKTVVTLINSRNVRHAQKIIYAWILSILMIVVAQNLLKSGYRCYFVHTSQGNGSTDVYETFFIIFLCKCKKVISYLELANGLKLRCDKTQIVKSSTGQEQRQTGFSCAS